MFSVELRNLCALYSVYCENSTQLIQGLQLLHDKYQIKIAVARHKITNDFKFWTR